MVSVRSMGGLILGLVLLAPGMAQASGFRIPDQGARQMGMANSGVANGSDASALYNNPAATGVLDGTYTAAGMTFIYAKGANFKSDTTLLPDETSDDQLFAPLHSYLTTDLGLDRWSFGLAAFSPYGLGRDWDQPRGFARNVDDVDLMTGQIQLSVTYELIDDLYVSVLGAYMVSKVNFEASPQGPGAAFGTHQVDLSADGDGWGYGLSAFWKPIERLSVGLCWRSEITVDYEGHAEANKIFPAFQPLPGIGGRSSFETGAETEIHFPSTTAFGFAYQFNDELTVEYDLEYIRWSTYHNLSAHLEQELVGVPPVGPLVPLLTNAGLSLEGNWHDTFIHRLGVSYQFNETWTARMGYAYDPTPVPDETLHPSLPDTDRHDLTFGVGYKSGDWTFDLSYMALFGEDRDVNNDSTATQNPTHRGTYENFAHLWAATIGKKW